MAIKKKYDATIPVQVERALYDRVKRVADDGRVNVSLAQVVRDALEVALPGFELQLGFLSEEDIDEMAEQAAAQEQPEKPKKEDRTAGLAWGPPKPE